jgi:hypothetical protein
MRGFYQQPKWAQFCVALALALSFWGVWLALLICLPLWAWCALFPLWVFHFMLAMTPWLRWTGVFVYHSAMLRAFLPRRGVCDLHTGTVFDYLAHHGLRGWGPVASKKILLSIIEGLVAISEEIRCGRLAAHTQVQLTSYFIRPKTLERYGFHIGRPDAAYWFNSVLSIFNIGLMYCYARGRVALPALHHARKAVISGPALVQAAPALRALVRRLERNCRLESPAVAPLLKGWPETGRVGIEALPPG